MADQANPGNVVRVAQGFNPSPIIGNFNKLTSANGSDMISTRSFVRAPFGGATGENIMTAAQNEVAGNPAFDGFYLNSPEDSQSLCMFYLPDVGNLFLWVHNGNGSNQLGEFAGYDGFGISVAQEKWGDKPSIAMGGAGFTEGDSVVSLCPEPPIGPYWVYSPSEPSELILQAGPVAFGTTYFQVRMYADPDLVTLVFEALDVTANANGLLIVGTGITINYGAGFEYWVVIAAGRQYDSDCYIIGPTTEVSYTP